MHFVLLKYSSSYMKENWVEHGMSYINKALLDPSNAHLLSFQSFTFVKQRWFNVLMCAKHDKSSQETFSQTQFCNHIHWQPQGITIQNHHKPTPLNSFLKYNGITMFYVTLYLFTPYSFQFCKKRMCSFFPKSKFQLPNGLWSQLILLYIMCLLSL